MYRPSGILNSGCLCYMISMIQQLNMMREFVGEISTIITDLNKKNQDPTTYNCLNNLNTCLSHLEHSSVTEEDLINLGKSISKTTEFDENEQRDVSDFFSEIIRNINITCKTLELPNNPLNSLSGKITHSLTAENSRLIEKVENFFYISLPVGGDIDCLTKSLELYTKAEELMFRWPSDSKEISGEKILLPTRKSTKFSILPRYLIFHLKRFRYNRTKMIKEKVLDKFTFPTHLNMTNFITANIQENGLFYRFSGCIIHKGKSANSGHYYSILRQRNQDQDHWWLCDDSTIELFDISNLSAHAYGTDSPGDDDSEESSEESSDESAGESSDGMKGERAIPRCAMILLTFTF